MPDPPAQSEATEPDTGEPWLPVPLEEREDPDGAERPVAPRGGGRIAFRADAGVRDGAWTARRAAVAGTSPGIAWSAWGLAVPRGAGTGAGGHRRGVTWRPTVMAAGGGRRIEAIAGAIRVSGDASPLMESIGLATRWRRPRMAGAATPGFEPPGSADAPALTGAGVALGRGPRGWLLVGRRVAGPALGAAGVVIGPAHAGSAGGSRSLALAVGAVPGRLAWSAAGEERSPGSRTGVELLATRSERSVLLHAEQRAAPFRAAGRWRYRSADAGRVAAELEASAAGRGAGLKLSWRSWSRGAERDDGRVELDGRVAAAGFGPARLRVGQRGVAADARGSSRAERYWIADWTAASGGGRSLTLFASRRARAGRAGRTLGSAVGGRLELEPGRWGRLDVRVEAARVGAAGDAAAWGSALDGSGSPELRARTRSGVTLTSRGIVNAGPVRLGHIVEQERRRDGTGSTSGRLWLEWR